MQARIKACTCIMLVKPFAILLEQVEHCSASASRQLSRHFAIHSSHACPGRMMRTGAAPEWMPLCATRTAARSSHLLFGDFAIFVQPIAQPHGLSSIPCCKNRTANCCAKYFVLCLLFCSQCAAAVIGHDWESTVALRSAMC